VDFIVALRKIIERSWKEKGQREGPPAQFFPSSLVWILTLEKGMEAVLPTGLRFLNLHSFLKAADLN